MGTSWDSWLSETFGTQTDPVEYNIERPVDRKRAAFQNIEDRMQYLEHIANQALGSAYLFIDNLRDELKNLKLPETNELNIEQVAIDPLNYSDRPGLDPINELDTTMPTLEKSLSLEEVDDAELDTVEFPLFSIDDPAINEPSLPDLEEIGDVPDAPSIRDIDTPTLGDITLPTAPIITETAIPAMPDFDIPEFDATLLPWDVQDPGEFTWGEPVYNSDIWADLLGKVLKDIREGGTGLSAQVEEDIYWQHLNRVRPEVEKKVRDAENYFASRGFTLPTGMLSAKINEVLSEVARDNMQASKDITISQAELAQKNTQFIIEQGRQLEGMMRQFFIDQANMSLAGQRAVAEHGIQLLNARIEKANYHLEEYKTKASVWGERVKAVATRVEMFKAQIEAARVTAETKKVLVDIYTAELTGADMLVKVFLGKMEGAKISSEIEQTRMALYGEQIKAYLAKVELNKAKLLQYSEQWEGEKTKVSVYTSKVQAYGARVDAMSKYLSALIEKMNSRNETNKLRVEEFKAYIDKYEADVRGKSEIVGAKVDAYKASTEVYKAETDRESAYYQVKLGEIDARIKQASLNLQQSVAKIDAAIKGFEAVSRLRVGGNEGIMQVASQLAASAIQGINTNSSMSYTGGDSYAQTEGFNTSISYNKNENVG